AASELFSKLELPDRVLIVGPNIYDHVVFAEACKRKGLVYTCLPETISAEIAIDRMKQLDVAAVVILFPSTNAELHPVGGCFMPSTQPLLAEIDTDEAEAKVIVQRTEEYNAAEDTSSWVPATDEVESRKRVKITNGAPEFLSAPSSSSTSSSPPLAAPTRGNASSNSMTNLLDLAVKLARREDEKKRPKFQVFVSDLETFKNSGRMRQGE
ncbi:unnamed protein product, partial [Amoebophrya sp. A120]